jgi:hypothetical protein
MFVLTAIITFFLAIIWSVFYLIVFENTIAAALAIGYTIVSSVALLASKAAKQFAIFSVVQTMLWLVVPAMVNVSLGGYYGSGGVIVWTIFAPLRYTLMSFQLKF